MRILLVSILLVCGLAEAKPARLSAQLNKDRNALIVPTSQGLKTFPLNLTEEMEVDLPIIQSSANDLIVVAVPVSIAALGTTYVFAIGANGKLLWKLDLESINPSTPLIEKNHVYVAALGRVMKLQKQTGRAVWKHDGLFENTSYQFNGSQGVVRVGNLIRFAPNVEVDDSNGRLLEVGK